ncbi:hypothetical protein P3T76_015510 [Phytophthora citrophthora]|uniref:Uncharacterized protein n=1 Tax=Phytophthora citrophthora TaxID=4793 RepID=A0AAD9FZG5_9STRA|nr:hypothetical protein P3T76_015510 [Phytophthora citrophthora]
MEIYHPEDLADFAATKKSVNQDEPFAQDLSKELAEVGNCKKMYREITPYQQKQVNQLLAK